MSRAQNAVKNAVNRQRTSAVKVGILSFISLSLLVSSLIWLRGQGLSGGDQYVVRFNDVNGMREGSSVQMMGVRVGAVDALKAVRTADNHYYVEVHFTLNKDLHIHLPPGSVLSIEQSGIVGDQFLEITPPKQLIAGAPRFKIENPMRIKRFLEIQVASAEALKLTNDKINQLLTEDSISSLQSTIKNTELLTAQANRLIVNANTLLNAIQQDFKQLSTQSEHLIANVSDVSHNINRLIDDPTLKDRLNRTLNSVQQSSEQVHVLLKNPEIPQTIHATRDASQNASQLLTRLRQTAEDQNLQHRLDHLMTETDSTVSRLNQVLSELESSPNGKGQDVKEMIQETKETLKNLHDASNKVKGHFILFKLLF